MITSKVPLDWKHLQKMVGYILSECGFEVEVEKLVSTARGTVKLDVYAEEVVKGRKYSIVCECKYWKRKVPQTIIHAFRTVVADIGANIAYIISLKGFQSGSMSAPELTSTCLQKCA
ncbi:MAG TPA: restriction endonuclease [Syntrophobacteraceae bacterium]|nr:restriction endonuclease [Syntrophobacteraceae bacterium]